MFPYLSITPWNFPSSRILKFPIEDDVVLKFNFLNCLLSESAFRMNSFPFLISSRRISGMNRSCNVWIGGKSKRRKISLLDPWLVAMFIIEPMRNIKKIVKGGCVLSQRASEYDLPWQNSTSLNRRQNRFCVFLSSLFEFYGRRVWLGSRNFVWNMGRFLKLYLEIESRSMLGTVPINRGTS